MADCADIWRNWNGVVWVISMANNNVTKGSLFPEPGTQLRIPTNINAVISLYNQYNTTK